MSSRSQPPPEVEVVIEVPRGSFLKRGSTGSLDFVSPSATMAAAAVAKDPVVMVDEVVELSTAAAERGGFYTSHLREEGLLLLESVSEAIEIGRRAQIPVVLTHHKVVGAPMWGSSARTLAMVDSASPRSAPSAKADRTCAEAIGISTSSHSPSFIVTTCGLSTSSLIFALS